MSVLCAECGQEIVYFGDGAPPSRCEDCVPPTGPGSSLLDRFSINLERGLDQPIKRVWLKGRTATEIAAALGTSTGSVSATVHRLREPPPTKAKRDALLMRLWREGRPEREIAEALDLADTR